MKGGGDVVFVGCFVWYMWCGVVDGRDGNGNGEKEVKFEGTRFPSSFAPSQTTLLAWHFSFLRFVPAAFSFLHYYNTTRLFFVSSFFLPTPHHHPLLLPPPPPLS